jgi:hypothetical protein
MTWFIYKLVSIIIGWGYDGSIYVGELYDE